MRQATMKPKLGEPWAYVAHRGDEWAGAAAGNMDRDDLKKFLGEFILDGFQITVCKTQDEYLKFLDGLKPLNKTA
jgi:hypothetical protein